jgi:hypothetical protein
MAFVLLSNDAGRTYIWDKSSVSDEFVALVIVEIIYAIVTERYNFSTMLLGFAISITNLRFETL